MKNQILLALKNSLIGNTQTLKQSNQRLSEFSKIQGYCMSLMQIIDQPTFDISLKQAALIQLKNNIKSKWKPKNQKLMLSATQKNHIRNALISAVVRCAKNYMLIKLYREVLTTIIGYQYQTWIPFQDILNLLSKGQNLAPIFHCIIAISTNFEFSVIQKQKQIYNQFLKVILPAVFTTVKNNLQDAQLIYLSLKILWKAVHYQIGNQIKILTNDWMELLYLTISAYNQQMQSKLDQYQNKNTPQFYYYHSKKWATRIVMRYIQRHAKAFQYGKVNQQNIQFSNFWYQSYGLKFCENILHHLSTPIPTTKKVRFFQLKTMQAIISDKPQMMAQHAKLFQYDVLLKFMVVTVEDQNLAKQDVVEFLRVDDQASMTYSNIKRVATQVWNSFLQIGSKIDKDQGLYYPGPLFQDSLKFMFEKITSQNLIEKQLGMYLFCENRLTINRVPECKNKMPQIIQTYVVPELSNPAILIRARAYDMFYQYGRQLKNVCLGKSIQAIYKGLTSDDSHLIRIKAATALNPLINHPECKQLLQPYLKQLLKAYLFLIQKYDLQQVVSALQYFIGDFSQSIGPYALQMFKFLQQVFHRMFTKDITLAQNQQYQNEVQLAASGCLKTMTQIIQSPLDPQIRAQIQPQILNVCAFLFTNQSYDYHQDMMYLMRVHLQKAQKITGPCWFFYQVIIYFIAGIPNQLWNQITNLNLPQSNKKILQSVRQGNNLQFLQHAIPVLRNYFGKGYNMIVSQKQQFKINFINMIFHLVGQVYRKGVTNVDLQGQTHLDCCSILLVYLVQTFPPEMTKPVLINIWNIIKFNLMKGKSIYLKQITCQLTNVLLWKHPIQFLQLLVKQKNLPAIIKHIKLVAPNLEQSQQKKRVILGLCTYLLVAEKDVQVLGKHSAQLFKILIKLVKKNCYTKIILNTKQQQLKKQIMSLSRNDSADQTINDDQDIDDEDLWDQQYNQRHISLLKKVNQLAYFKQTILKINAQSPQIYQIIMGSVQNQKLAFLSNLIEKAIDLPEK